MSNLEKPTKQDEAFFDALKEAFKPDNNLIYRHVNVIGGKRVETTMRILND